MSKLQWGAFAAIVGVVVITQLPHHDHDTMEGHQGSGEAVTADVVDSDATVLLAVSGMT